MTNPEVSKYFLYVTRKNDDPSTFSFPVFSRGERHKLLLSNLSSLVLLLFGIYFKAVFIFISRNIGNHNVCVWSCIQLLSDYFLSADLSAAIVKLTIGAISIIVQAITTDTEKDAQKGVPGKERECFLTTPYGQKTSRRYGGHPENVLHRSFLWMSSGYPEHVCCYRSFALACIFLNILVALLVEFSYTSGKRTLQQSLHIKPYPYTLSTHRYRR